MPLTHVIRVRFSYPLQKLSIYWLGVFFYIPSLPDSILSLLLYTKLYHESKKTVFLTGATGTMGHAGLVELSKR